MPEVQFATLYTCKDSPEVRVATLYISNSFLETTATLIRCYFLYVSINTDQ